MSILGNISLEDEDVVEVEKESLDFSRASCWTAKAEVRRELVLLPGHETESRVLLGHPLHLGREVSTGYFATNEEERGKEVNSNWGFKVEGGDGEQQV